MVTFLIPCFQKSQVYLYSTPENLVVPHLCQKTPLMEYRERFAQISNVIPVSPTLIKKQQAILI